MNEWFDYDAVAKILVFGLLAGAALPALFALGVRLNAAGAGVTDEAGRRHPLFAALSWAIFALVLLIVVISVLFIARDFIGHRTGWYILGATPG